jgi:hypothetical protein
LLVNQEWDSFVHELYEAVDQQLKESHVASFSELTEAQRLMFIQRARQAIGGGAYSV